LRTLPPADLKRIEPGLLARYGQATPNPETGPIVVAPGAAAGPRESPRAG
jgi:hypothetical protein